MIERLIVLSLFILYTMSVYLLLFLVNVVLGFVYNISDFVNIIKGNIAKFLTGTYNENWQLKPLTCSQCMSFWICLILIICIEPSNIYLYFYNFLLAFLHPRINDLLFILDSIGSKIMMKINQKLN